MKLQEPFYLDDNTDPGSLVDGLECLSGASSYGFNEYIMSLSEIVFFLREV